MQTNNITENQPDSQNNHTTITEEEIQFWCSGSFGNYFTLSRLTDIITGEYDLQTAREDILSFRKPQTNE